MGIESLRIKNVELQQKICIEDPVPIVVLFCSVVKKESRFHHSADCEIEKEDRLFSHIPA